MLNILGISLSFVGTVFTLALLIFGKSEPEFSYSELKDMGKKNSKNKILSIIGLVLITVGFIIQLYVAVKDL